MEEHLCDEIAWSGRLLEEFADICHAHNIEMAVPIIRISDSKQHYGLWEPDLKTISVSRHLIESYPWYVVLEVLKHEMAHQYVSLVMHRPGGHGPDFKKACHILGVHPDFTKAGGKLTPEMFGPEKALSPKADKMIRTVQKLLSLAGSDNENEAGSASRKANELIRKHNLDLFQDGNQLHRHKAAYLVITHKKKQITRLQKSILGILNEFYYVSSVLTGYYDARDRTSYQSMVLFGLPENLKIAEYVYHYLHETGNRLWQKNRAARGYTRRDRISFDIGFTQGIKKTLAASGLPVHAGPERTKALIAVNNALTSSMDKIIRAEAGRVFPKTIRRSSRYRHSESAFHQGYEEGRNTHIKKGIHQKGENTLRYLA